jgi:hypothetical protein
LALSALDGLRERTAEIAPGAGRSGSWPRLATVGEIYRVVLLPFSACYRAADRAWCTDVSTVFRYRSQWSGGGTAVAVFALSNVPALLEGGEFSCTA